MNSMALALAMAAALALMPNGSSAEEAVLTPVSVVDLNRYAGKWYEIAKIPNWFQKSCTRGTTAEYVVQPDGQIEVINRCIQEDGSLKEAKGVARSENPPANSKLKVSFVRFLWRQWFWGNYWIIALGENYEYAIVGEPERKYGWILARQPVLDPSTLEKVNQILERQGYDPADFEMTRH